MNHSRDTKNQFHPREKAGILSILTYCWTFPTFLKGLRKDLDESDLFPPLKVHSSSTLGDKLEESWTKEKKLNQNPSLLRALGRVFGLELVTFGFVLMFIELGLKMLQPLALSQLLKYYTVEDNKIKRGEAIMYGSIIVGSCVGYAIVAHWYSLELQHFGMKVRVACCSLIYRKSLRLRRNAAGEAAAGHMVNLLSNDVNRFDQAAVHLHSLWFVPIETAIIVYILHRIVGVTATIGVLTMTFFVPLQVYLGRKIASLRLKTALKTDDRIQLMNEIIAGFQVIKMYTWEKQFIKLVEAARKLEISKISATSYLRGIMLSFSIFTTRLAVFCTIVVYVTLGNDLTAEYVFVLISFYNILRQAVTRYYPQGITQIGEASVSISRIQNFLLYDEVDLDQQIFNMPQDLTNNDENLSNKANIGITLCNVSAKWSSDTTNKTLRSVSLSIQQGQFVAITGAVGSGKTSLLLAVLKELPIQKGTIRLNGKISYASQEPWLFAGTVKQNILFTQVLDPERYQKVISMCQLEHDISVLPYGDESIVGERGTTLSGGQKARISLARAIYQEADIYLLDDPLSAVDAQVGRKLVENCISNFLKDKCTILVTHQFQHLRNVHRIIFMENGRIITSVNYQDLKNLGILTSENNNETKLFDYNNKSIDANGYFPKSDQAPSETKENRSFGKISRNIYFSYFQAGGSFILASFVFAMFVFTQFFASSADFFIAYWVNLEKEGCFSNKTSTQNGFAYTYISRDICIYIYTVLMCTTIIVTLVRSFSFFKYSMEASKKLHNDMFSNIIHVSISFFNKNSSGRILNRFSKDMGSIDESLPSVVMDCIQIGLTVIGVTVVVSFVNPWLLLVTTFILIIFYILRTVYLATSRSIKRLEGITRSPVFAHMNASLQGITTIRAFGAQKALQREFDEHQDLHSSSWYLFLSCTRAFGFWLDMICACYIGIVTFSFLFVKNEQHGGNVGLAITQAISLTGLFQWGMRQWSELENQMTSVERIVEFTETEREAERDQIVPTTNWPEKGGIEFLSVSLKYCPTDTYVLNQVSFNIKAKEKIGIVGRTGAGKTSLVYALFQLIKIDGTIIIDGVDITQVPLETLRSKISIIPQEPFLFSGTLRKNLDPFNEYADDDIWKALAEVDLKEVIADLPSGIDENVSEGGSNFSVGQRQLICLARAIIRSNKILVMDEATANLDAKTDALIQATIRRKFAECTVLTIAHRLYTIMDSDKVLIMDCGKSVEFDQPYALLRDETSLFYNMVHQNGNLMAETLTKIAEKSYKIQTHEYN